jgi:glutamate synthase domain-containing protein 3
MATIDAAGRTSREINAELRRLIAAGETQIAIENPGARHNLGVAVLTPVHINLTGSVGYYCGGLIDGAQIDIAGSAGWGLGESMLTGTIRVQGSAGNGAAAAIRGGTVVIHGDASARLGVSMKGGTVIVAGNCGYMAGFMGQKGTLIVCGNAGDAFADSMYATTCFVGGEIASLGNDAVVSAPDATDIECIEAALSSHLPADVRQRVPQAGGFKKVVAGRKLWNFDKHDLSTWQEAL